MPRQKLLDAQAAGVTGTGVKVDPAKPPYAVMITGTAAAGAGAAGTNGVNILVSADDSTYFRCGGIVGVQGSAPAYAAAQDLAANTFVMIEYPVRYIRADTGANMTGSATVWLQMPE